LHPKCLIEFLYGIGLKGDVAIAKRSGQLEFNVCRGLLLKVGQFNSAAKSLEGQGPGLGFKFAFDGLVNPLGQLRVARGFGEDSFEQIQQLRFIRLLCFFFHHPKWAAVVQHFPAELND
jgi:hypothetical protein